MRKVLFGTLVVILSTLMASADDIKELTLDTPVNWPVTAFNRSIGQYCWGRYYSVSDATIGSFIESYEIDDEYIKEHKSFKPINRTVSDLDDNCGSFVLTYASEFRKTPAMSLRKIIDMCMSTIKDAGKCANMMQSLVYYSLGHDGIVKLESQIAEDDEKLYSEDGKFYVHSALSYQNIDDDTKTAPQHTDDGLYLSDSNERVGTCINELYSEKGSYSAAQCEMTRSYAGWRCFHLDNKLDCRNHFVAYQRIVLEKLPEVVQIYKDRVQREDIEPHIPSFNKEYEPEKHTKKTQQRLIAIRDNTVRCIETSTSQIIDKAADDIRTLFDPDQEYSYDQWQQIQQSGGRLSLWSDMDWGTIRKGEITTEVRNAARNCREKERSEVAELLGRRW